MSGSKLSKVLVWGELSEEKFRAKIFPLLTSNCVSQLYIVRFSGCPASLIENSRCVWLRPNTSSKRKYELFSFLKALHLILKGKIDLLIGVYFVPHGIYTTLLSFITFRKSIQILTGTDLLLIKRIVFFKYLLKLSDMILVRGTTSNVEVQNLGIQASKIDTLQNLMDRNEIISIKDRTFNKREYDLIFIGYLRKLKRLDLLVEIIKKLSLDFPEIKCAIIGDGPYKEALIHLIQKNNLNDNIILVGHRANVYPYLDDSKIFVLTSESEGLNMAMIEGMSRGLPVVVPRINDLPDIVVDGETGYLIEFGNITDYVKKIRELLLNEALYNQMSLKSVTKIQQLYSTQFSLDATSTHWLRIIKNLN